MEAGRDRATAWILVAALLAAGAGNAAASHMTMYDAAATEHDDQGALWEPDGVVTSVFTGAPLQGRNLDADTLGGGLNNPGGASLADPPPYQPTNPLTGVGGYNVHGHAAPGCTAGDGGTPRREPNGLCALHTIGLNEPNTGLNLVPPGTAGVEGFDPGGPLAPGAYTPLKTSRVRLLDGQHTPVLLVTPTRWIELEKKAADHGLPYHRLPLPESYWAWMGEWQDLNGNGVVDHDGTGNQLTPNEFTWLGGCMNFANRREPASIAAGLCREDPNPHLNGTACANPQSTVGCALSSMAYALFPGNRFDMVNDGPNVPGGYVQTWALHFADCSEAPTCDDDQADGATNGASLLGGDPLLDAQDAVTAEGVLVDRTGDMGGDGSRQWVAGSGFPTHTVDDGTVITSIEAYGYNCFIAWGRPLRVSFPGCRFLDLDKTVALNPDLETLLVGCNPENPANAPGCAGYPNGGLKGLARGFMLCLATECKGFDAPNPDSLLNHRLVHTGPDAATGAADDLLLDPGWSREPNTPGDRYPGVAWAACNPGDWPVGIPPVTASEAQHRGHCNAPVPADPGCAGVQVAYACHRLAPQAWNDARSALVLAAVVPVTTLHGGFCTACLFAPVATGLAPLPPAHAPVSADDHARTLAPGIHAFGGHLGTWRDQPHDRVEPGLLGSVVQTYRADGWVGFLAAATGQTRDRGYADHTDADPLPSDDCRTEQGPAGPANPTPAAECDPYLQGNVDDPQDYAVRPQGEWWGHCPGGTSPGDLLVSPADGVLDAPLAVWRAARDGVALVGSPDPPWNGDATLEVVPAGAVAADGWVHLRTACGPANLAGQGGWGTLDYLVLPAGSAEPFLTRMAATVGGASVVDEDRYAAWAP